MTQVQRIATYLVILAAVVLLAWFGTPRQHFTPRGVLLPSGSSNYAAISPQQVQFTTNTLLSGNDVGVINVEYYAPNMNDQRIRETELYAANLAAAEGANNVVIVGLFRDPQEKTIHLFGRAVRS